MIITNTSIKATIRCDNEESFQPWKFRRGSFVPKPNWVHVPPPSFGVSKKMALECGDCLGTRLWRGTGWIMERMQANGLTWRWWCAVIMSTRTCGKLLLGRNCVFVIEIADDSTSLASTSWGSSSFWSAMTVLKIVEERHGAWTVAPNKTHEGSSLKTCNYSWTYGAMTTYGTVCRHILNFCGVHILQSAIFTVEDTSAKSVKIVLLENLALYRMYIFLNMVLT